MEESKYVLLVQMKLYVWYYMPQTKILAACCGQLDYLHSNILRPGLVSISLWVNNIKEQKKL